MTELNVEHLRVLIANERKDRLDLQVPIVVALGHEIMRERSASTRWERQRPGSGQMSRSWASGRVLSMRLT
jgi:hypothetical protein